MTLVVVVLAAVVLGAGPLAWWWWRFQRGEDEAYPLPPLVIPLPEPEPGAVDSGSRISVPLVLNRLPPANGVHSTSGAQWLTAGPMLSNNAHDAPVMGDTNGTNGANGTNGTNGANGTGGTNGRHTPTRWSGVDFGADSDQLFPLDHRTTQPLRSSDLDRYFPNFPIETDDTGVRYPYFPLDEVDDSSDTIRFARPGEDAVQLLPGRLVVVAGGRVHREIRFFRIPGEPPHLILGREKGESPLHVGLGSPTVSRQHARLDYDNGRWEIRNLSRTNPLVVNDDELSDSDVARLLVDGDRLELGEVVLRFHSH